MSRKGWIVVGVVVGIWVLLLAGVGAVAVAVLGDSGGFTWDEQNVDGDGPQKIAIVDVRGEIAGGEGDDGLGGSTAGSADVRSQLRQAGEDADVAAVILRIDSPGGAVVASDEIYREVKRLNEDKPVVAAMGDLAASGGYYVASAAERIVANPATLTGSIGVILMVPNVQGAADKLGLSTAVIKSGQFKDAGSPFRPLEPEEREMFQELIDEAYGQFVTAVAEGRGMKAADVRKLADGRVYSGSQAEANGLVDELGDLETAWDAAVELAKLDRDESQLVDYTSGGSFADLFAPPSFGSPVGEAKRELGLGFGLKYLYLP